jgi:hypothetical protein
MNKIISLLFYILITFLSVLLSGQSRNSFYSSYLNLKDNNGKELEILQNSISNTCLGIGQLLLFCFQQVYSLLVGSGLIKLLFTVIQNFIALLYSIMVQSFSITIFFLFQNNNKNKSIMIFFTKILYDIVTFSILIIGIIIFSNYLPIQILPFLFNEEFIINKKNFLLAFFVIVLILLILKDYLSTSLKNSIINSSDFRSDFKKKLLIYLRNSDPFNWKERNQLNKKKEEKNNKSFYEITSPLLIKN